MDQLADELERTASARSFSGVVRVEHSGRVVAELARGLAHRSEGIANASDTRFGAASVTKGLTALTVMSLVESAEITFDTPVRSILGDALPLVDERVTIEHLLTHRSGVGDYIDEDAIDDIDDHTLAGRSAHLFERPADYVELLAPLPQVASPGERFAYNNGGYVILSMIVEQVTGSFHAAVDERVVRPAGMLESGFFRSDQLPERTALGYLRDGRTNVFHLPVIGAGDGGIHLTAPDCSSFWKALRAGRIVGRERVAEMTSVVSSAWANRSYGVGFWLSADADHVWLEGMDAGVSAQTGWIRSADLVYSVLSNTSDGAWPMVESLLASTVGVPQPATSG